MTTAERKDPDLGEVQELAGQLWQVMPSNDDSIREVRRKLGQIAHGKMARRYWLPHFRAGVRWLILSNSPRPSKKLRRQITDWAAVYGSVSQQSKGSDYVSRRIDVILTEDEHAQFKEAARKAGQSLSEWMRYSAALHLEREGK